MPSKQIALWQETRFGSRYTRLTVGQNMSAAKYRHTDPWVLVPPSPPRRLSHFSAGLSAVFGSQHSFRILCALLSTYYFIFISISTVSNLVCPFLSFLLFFLHVFLVFKSHWNIVEKKIHFMSYKKSQLPTYFSSYVSFVQFHC